MSRPLSTEWLSRLSDLVAENLGLHFPPERYSDLERALAKAAVERGYKDAGSFAERVLNRTPGDEDIQLLASHLTIGETHFFRDEKLFQTLEQRLLPEIANASRPVGSKLRIWSAGCSSGEEPYSVAVALTRVLALSDTSRVDILATDINPLSLRKAARGMYAQWSFRGVPSWVKERYFRKTGNGLFEILPNIKQAVKFSQHNLVKDAFPPVEYGPEPMDLIFCRNVLMYFTDQQIRLVVRNLCRCLREGGWLIVAPAEAELVQDPQLVTVSFPGGVLFRKHRDLAGEEDEFAPSTSLFFPDLGMDAFGELHIGGLGDATDQSDAVFTQIFGSPLTPAAIEEALAPSSLTIEPDAGTTGLQLLADGDTAAGFLASRPRGGQTGPDPSVLARTVADQGDLPRALELCREAIAADKLNPGYHYLHGEILQELGQLDEAASSLRKALYLDPGMVMAHFALGTLARRLGRIKESDRHFTTALKCLGRYDREEIVVESEGLTAGRLAEIILTMTKQEAANAGQ